MKAVLCPVCNGSGKIQPTGDQSGCELKTCHGCNGNGWVEVQEDPYPTCPSIDWYKKEQGYIFI